MANPQTAVTVIDQEVESGVVEWSLDGFPEDRYNRLVPVETLQIPTDLLRPVVQVVRLNPDPKNGGDVYTSKDTPAGHAAPTKVALRKFATAAGISFVDERRTDDGRDPDVIEVTCVAEMLLPTGQRLRAVGTKRIDLNAQKWESENHRLKYRSYFQEHVASRAENRAIRALLSLRGSYPLEVYQRPFALDFAAVSSNITSHPERGLGAWTDDEIKRAITTGVSRDGRELLPFMAFGYYENISAQDLDALIAYLRTIPPGPLGD